MKRVLITAGQVYGPLDANKVVGNRIRGVWATRFAEYLAGQDYEVILLVPDINTPVPTRISPGRLVTHRGYWDYAEKCVTLAAEVQGAVFAAAVVNWIPAEPYSGKMPTAGFKEGDVIQVPFMLAPHVIDLMKMANPRMALIGCKMLVNAPEADLIEAAYGVLLKAHCNAVVANDMGKGLKRKMVVNQDGTVQEYNDDFQGLYANLLAHIEDEHYRTERHFQGQVARLWMQEGNLFDAVVAKYRNRFVQRQDGADKVFGAVCLPNRDGTPGGICSPREKGKMFTVFDAVDVTGIKDRILYVNDPRQKATLNAPLLIRVGQKYPQATAILHLHEQLPDVPTVPYAPPGTVRDNEREIPGPVFNIEGHGFIACLDSDLNIWAG